MLNFVRTIVNEIACFKNNMGLFMAAMKGQVDSDLFSKLENSLKKIQDGVSDLEGLLI